MPRYKTPWLPLILLCALAAAAPPLWHAGAQANPLKVSVPFEFLVNGEAAPSGRYAITPATASAQGLRIRSADGRLTRTTATSRARREGAQGALVAFNVYGERHFLSEVFWPGSADGFRLTKCKEELELEEAAKRDTGAAQLRRVVIGE